jgi:hypothetical protein
MRPRSCSSPSVRKKSSRPDLPRNPAACYPASVGSAGRTSCSGSGDTDLPPSDRSKVY